jgi:hypothetical protein
MKGIKIFHHVVHNTSVGSVLAYSARDLGSILTYIFSWCLKKHQVCNGFGGHDVYFLVACALFFFPFIHSHSRMRVSQMVSQCERLKTHQYSPTAKLWHCQNGMEHIRLRWQAVTVSSVMANALAIGPKAGSRVQSCRGQCIFKSDKNPQHARGPIL